MLLNDPPSYTKPELKKATSASSLHAPSVQEIDDESIFVENETIYAIYESQPRILYEDDGLEGQVIEQIPDETKVEDSVSRKSFKCCSKHFGLIPFLSTMTLFINIALLVLVALLIIVPSQVAETVPIKELLISRASVKTSFVYLRDLFEISVLNNTLEILDYRDYCLAFKSELDSYNQSVFKMFPLIPKSYDHYSFMKGSDEVDVFFPLYQDWTDMVQLFCKMSGYTNNNTITNTSFYQIHDEYMRKYKNESFQKGMATFETNLFDFLEDIYTVCNSIDDFTIGSGIAVLICSCTACVIVIPVGILNYAALGLKLINDELKVRNESTNILKDTMADQGMRDEFKMFCKKAKVEVPFSILEKIQYFKAFCKESIDCQFKLFEITKEYVVETKTVGKGADMYIQQVSNELEKKLSHLERFKSEIIFEIITTVQSQSIYLSSMDWIIHQIDLYNNREGSYEIVDILHSKILDNLEKEISDILSLTHFQFKSTHALNMNTSPNSPQSPTIDLPLI